MTYQNTPECTRTHQDVPEHTRMYRDTPGCTRTFTTMYQDTPGCTRVLTKTYQGLDQDIYQNTPRCTRTQQNVPEHTRTYQDIPRHTRTYRGLNQNEPGLFTMTYQTLARVCHDFKQDVFWPCTCVCMPWDVLTTNKTIFRRFFNYIRRFKNQTCTTTPTPGTMRMSRDARENPSQHMPGNLALCSYLQSQQKMATVLQSSQTTVG